MAVVQDDKVLKKVGKRPKSATQIAQQLGFATHHGVAASLGRLVKSGQVVRNGKGYVKAE
jgi:predicted Rossmann fold nucleotide-binding protein DprA/Smf involved in DNA uptake